MLKHEESVLVGDVLLASAFISYIGPFDKRFRKELLSRDFIAFLEKAANGDRIPMSADPDPLRVLVNDAQIAKWNSQHLPADHVSIENGAIMVNSARWPLMIDPQLQGITWIREKEAKNGLVLVRMTQVDMLTKLERCMETGGVLVIENMDEKIDAVLMPAIRRAVMSKGHRKYVKLGDKEVEFNSKFRLILHTKLANPHYPPEIQAETTLVNFTVTEEGLEDQLLSLVVRKERPDLAQKRSMLIQEQNEFKIKIKELEDTVLEKLAAAEGDLTEDVELIENLENTKRIAKDVQHKAAIAKKTEAEISRTSEQYRPVAARGSLLFFLMNELYKVHTYYVYSLNAFIVTFLRGIDLVSQAKTRADSKAKIDTASSEEQKEEVVQDKKVQETTSDQPQEEAKSSDDALSTQNAKAAEDGKGEVVESSNENAQNGSEQEKVEESGEQGALELSEEMVSRLQELSESITSIVFNYLRRGLFERDKLTVATMLCLRILLRAGELDSVEADALVLNRTASDLGHMGPLSDWLSISSWSKIKALETLSGPFAKIGEDMCNSPEDWRDWFDLEQPELKTMPDEYRKLGQFHRLLVLRALRPDRVTSALTTFVGDCLGEEYVNQPAFNMEEAYNESSPFTPIFFVLFPGVDPTPLVERLGERHDITIDNGKFINISMGQGQEKPAEEAVKQLAKTGGWIMLQNLHLMQSWLPRLERQLELVAETAHPNFRCFISAEPPPLSTIKNIPESLLQTCIKVANEAPSDLKSNLRRAWANFDQDRLDGCKKTVEFRGCLFTLSFYHAIVLGRRKFGQQGWSRGYSFNTGDLTVCANVLENYLNDNEAVPWDDLRYIIGEIMYGGHITDAWDRRTNATYLQVLFNPMLLDQGALAPGFVSPNVRLSQYEDYRDEIEHKLPMEAPQLFGMHPNAEIGYLSTSTDSLFSTIIEIAGTGGISGGGGSGNGSGESKGTGNSSGSGGNAVKRSVDIVRANIDSLIEKLPEEFNMLDLQSISNPLLSDTTKSPFVIVALQECERMNTLIHEIRRSLIELRMGLDGQLNMTDAMEDLMKCLLIGRVPGRDPFDRCNWESLAWPSKKPISSWFSNMLQRVEQLAQWTDDFIVPDALWLPGLFNPMAFLTAIMQVTARRDGMPLNAMTIETHVTTMLNPQQIERAPTDGAFIYGLFIEGARWTTEEESGSPKSIGGVDVAGHLTDSRLKDLLPPMPVLYIRAVAVQPQWEPSSVGYLRHDSHTYDCPVYSTTFRGPTYVFLATLNVTPASDADVQPNESQKGKEQEKAKVAMSPVQKWTLAGVAIILQSDD